MNAFYFSIQVQISGRVLQDSMKLDSDNGKMDGSAVHVVESAPPGSGSSGSGSNSRPSTSSASRTQERLINGETIQVLQKICSINYTV